RQNVAGTQGGALRLRYSATGTVSDVDFENNTAGWDGGAVTSSDSSSLTIDSGSTFIGNSAATDGGAISSTDASALFVSDSTFTSNLSDRGGAIFSADGSSPSDVSGSSFLSNAAWTDRGGAIANAGSSLMISLCSFENNTSSASGGAVSTTDAPLLSITDSSFKQNEAQVNGGALDSDGGSAATIIDTNFSDNIASTHGGAISATTASLTISGGDISTNHALGGDGGGVYQLGGLVINSTYLGSNEALLGSGGGAFAAGLDTTLNDVWFEENRADVGGGVCVAGGPATVEIDSCHFRANGASKGGGLATPITDFFSTSTVNVRDTVFEFNNAIGGPGGGAYHEGLFSLIFVNYKWSDFRWNEGLDNNCVGGGLALISTDTVVHNTRFRANKCDTRGGGLFSSLSILNLSNSEFSGNWAEVVGGAIRIENQSYVHLANNTLNTNGIHPLEAAATGVCGGLSVYDSTASIYNTIFYNNEDDLTGQSFTAQLHLSAATTTWEYNLFDYGPGCPFLPTTPTNFCGSANLIDPLGPDGYAGTGDVEDIRLLAGSSAIDAGDTNRVLDDVLDVDDDPLTTDPIPLDLGVIARFQDDLGTADTGVTHALYPSLPIVDIGAHEFAGVTPAGQTGDADGDGDVDFADLNILLGHWNMPVAAGTSGDVDGDGDVDFNDLNTLLSHWGEGT
ncbi:MAG: hypothetical protein KDA21_05165, partial [Phycisphaerales bacterium]|nr:hypothetical protein [Phycisphaerales bacterium]